MIVSNVGTDSNTSGVSNIVYSEPNLANQFAYYYNMILGIPREETEGIIQVGGKKPKNGDDIFKESNKVRKY